MGDSSVAHTVNRMCILKSKTGRSRYAICTKLQYLDKDGSTRNNCKNVVYDDYLCTCLFSMLSPEKWVWSHPKVKGAPSPSLAAHGCAVLDKRIYLFGGLTPSGAASDKLYTLDTGARYLTQCLKFLVTYMCVDL